MWRQRSKMLREQMAEELFYEDWDAESGYAYANALNGYWGEQDELLKDHYHKRASKLINLFKTEVGSPKTRATLKDDIGSYSEVYHIGITAYDQWEIVDRIMKKLVALMEE